MVRHYTGEPIEREVLERIASTIRRAPSAGFSQGQRLLVVDDPSVLERLAELRPDPEGTEPWFESAPAHIVVLASEADYHARYTQPDKLQDGKERVWPAPFWYVDGGAALMLVLLAALDEGLAASVYSVSLALQPAFRELLRIDPALHIVAGVTVGRPLPDPEWSRRASRRAQPRRPLHELVRWNTGTGGSAPQA
jgi:nitroreductase